MKTPVWTLNSLAREIEATKPGPHAAIRIDAAILAGLVADARSLHSLTTLAQAVGAARTLTSSLETVMAEASGLVALLDAAHREPRIDP